MMNSTYHYILTTKNSKEWKDLLDRIEDADIFFDPDYIKLLEWEGSFGDFAELFVFKQNNKLILSPYFLRDLGSLPFLPERSELFDMISPYGYAGIITNISKVPKNAGVFRAFFSAFNEYAHDRKIVSEFGRLNPYIDNHLIYEISEKEKENVTKLQQIVYFDLTRTDEELLMSMDQSHRRYLRKAIKNDLEIERTTDPRDIKEFEDIYNKTMKHVKAKEGYFYGKDFFKHGFELLKEKIVLFVARYNGETIAGAIFIWLKDSVHYWYGGSKPEFRSFYPNNLLFFEAAKYFKSQGFKYLNMGGGNSPSEEDTLFKFKYRFTKMVKWFYIYKKIHIEKDYNELIGSWEKYLDNQNKLDDHKNSNFFPKYRAGL